MEELLSQFIVNIDRWTITCGDVPNSVNRVSYGLIRLISVRGHKGMLQFVARVHSPAHDTAISTDSY